MEYKLSKLLGVKYPIIQAPMAGESTVELVAAVSNAGGLGSLGCARMKPNEVIEAAQKIRKATSGSFNLNFFCHAPPDVDKTVDADLASIVNSRLSNIRLARTENAIAHYSYDEALLAATLEIKPTVVSFHFGLPEESIVTQLKEAGIVVMSSACNLDEALLLERSGADVIIAQGWEAGGHRGNFQQNSDFQGVGLFSLIPQLVEAVSVPIVAAGGIYNGRGIMASMMLGASGAQLGTAFIATPEANISPEYEEALRNATMSNSRITKAYSGRLARAKLNDYIEEVSSFNGEYPDFPTMYQISRQIVEDASEKGEDLSFYLYGQSASKIRWMPASDLIKVLAREMTEATLS